MRLYLSGAITNVPNHREVFNNERERLVRAGYTVLDPHDIPACYFSSCGGNKDTNTDVYHHTWQCNLIHDVAELVFCDGIAMIPGWEASQGANLEIEIMRRLKLPYNTVNGWMYHLEKLSWSRISNSYVLQQLTVDFREQK